MIQKNTKKLFDLTSKQQQDCAWSETANQNDNQECPSPPAFYPSFISGFILFFLCSFSTFTLFLHSFFLSSFCLLSFVLPSFCCSLTSFLHLSETFFLPASLSFSLSALMSHQSLFFLSAASTASGEEEGPDLLRSKFTHSLCESVFKKTAQAGRERQIFQVKFGKKVLGPSAAQKLQTARK